MALRWTLFREANQYTPDNPNAASSTAPNHHREESISERHTRVFPRMPSRGDSLPFQGRAVVLPDNTIGGIPIGIPATLQGANMIQAEVGQGVPLKAVPYTVRRAALLKAYNEKAQVVRINPGLHPMDFAKAPRAVPDTPSGFRGGFNDMHSHKSKGQLEQQTRMPKSVYDVMAKTRPTNFFSGTTEDGGIK